MKPEIKEVETMSQAISQVMISYPKLSKYRLAKDLNLSTSSHIDNYLTGNTKKARVEVMGALYRKYHILVANYKETPEYRAITEASTIKGIKL